MRALVHLCTLCAGEAEANLERALREIEQLKTDREVAEEKKDKQILQLKTLMAKFKKVSSRQCGLKTRP